MNRLFILFFFICLKAYQVVSEESDSSVCTARRGSIKCINEICSFNRQSIKCTDRSTPTPKRLKDIDASKIGEFCMYLGDTVDKTLPFWNQPLDVLKQIEVFVEAKYFQENHVVVSNQNLSDYNKENCKLRFHTPVVDWLVYNLAIPMLCIFVIFCMTISSRPK